MSRGNVQSYKHTLGAGLIKQNLLYIIIGVIHITIYWGVLAGFQIQEKIWNEFYKNVYQAIPKNRKNNGDIPGTIILNHWQIKGA